MQVFIWHVGSRLLGYALPFTWRSDLLEVCEAQFQFLFDVNLAIIGGTSGSDISKSILDIRVIGHSRAKRMQGNGQ
jgi:hypothetical protein